MTATTATTTVTAMTGLRNSSQTMSLVAFTSVATITLLLCVMTGPDRDDLDEFYTGYGSLSTPQRPCHSG